MYKTLQACLNKILLVTPKTGLHLAKHIFVLFTKNTYNNLISHIMKNTQRHMHLAKSAESENQPNLTRLLGLHKKIWDN